MPNLFVRDEEKFENEAIFLRPSIINNDRLMIAFNNRVESSLLKKVLQFKLKTTK